MSSRRKFLSALPALGAGTMLARGNPARAQAAPQASQPSGITLPLNQSWHFRLDREGTATAPEIAASEDGWQAVTVPHTWQTLGRNPDYVGVAWYRTHIPALEEWQDRFVRIEFEAVFHTAHVFLNSVEIGRHIGKGYTAFQCDLSPSLKIGQANVLAVRVDNSPSNTMLPRLKSFDWTNDGGLIRPVTLLVTPQVFIERIEIDATANLEANTAQVAVRALVRNTHAEEQPVRLAGSLQREGSLVQPAQIPGKTLRLAAASTHTVALDAVTIASPELWHFDAPNLYEASITLQSGDASHACSDLFGIRRFEARGTEFYLNGERVRLMGVERMAGSHPQFGMAEPTQWIDTNHRDMKDLNCVFTRVHWPQDQRVLDFCDRNGILFQEEVPAWGPGTFSNIDADLLAQLTTNGLEQLREMVARDRNHPCIVSWGLCNEVDGKNPNSRAFAHSLAKEARATDPARLLTYASHSLRQYPEQDMAGDFDFISANEYFGSWYPGGPPQLRAFLDSLRRAFPLKPIVISEYGWCECQPSIPPGDADRVKIVNDHTDVIRESGLVAGAIYFDYNDYRTIVGDHGIGPLRQRVHGVVDLYSHRKPSFDALRAQASPVRELRLSRTGNACVLNFTLRERFPAYTLRNYAARWLFFGYDDLPMEGRLDPLPDLAPGATFTLKANSSVPGVKRVAVEILRPTGFAAAQIELDLSKAS